MRTPSEEARHVIANDEGIAAAIGKARAEGYAVGWIARADYDGYGGDYGAFPRTTDGALALLGVSRELADDKTAEVIL